MFETASSMEPLNFEHYWVVEQGKSINNNIMVEQWTTFLRDIAESR
jgi:hypothetical protein